MRSWPFRILLLLMIGLLLFFFSQELRRAYLAAFLLEATLKPEGGALLSSLTAPPRKASLSFRLEEESLELKAYLYLPARKARHPAILLVHGLSEWGRDDPRLQSLAGALSRAGFAVLLPEFPAMKALRAEKASSKRIARAFRHLISLEEVDSTRAGILAFSFGAGPVFLASAEPELGERLSFIIAFGPYFEPQNVIRYITTGSFEYEDESGRFPPEASAKWLFLAYNLHLIASERDRMILEEVVRRKLMEEGADIEELRPALGSEGSHILTLIENKDPLLTEPLLQGLSPRLKGMLKDFSLKRAIERVRARVYLAHGKPDPFIPHTESLRLARALPKGRLKALAILSLFGHTDPREGLSLTALKEGAKFYGFIYAVLGEAK